MGFAAALVLTYATAIAALISFAASAYGGYQLLGVTAAAIMAWVVLMIGMALAFRHKALWAIPSALPALFPPATLLMLMHACATGSSSCF